MMLDPEKLDPAVSQAIMRCGIELKMFSSWMKAASVDHRGDSRALRAELMLEELGESLEALAAGDELALLDGLADLIYVVVGTATTFKLPVEAAFREVHRSNMTKNSHIDHAAGVTGKGPQFKSPKLRAVLNHARGKDVCDVCGFAHGELRAQATGGLRAVKLLATSHPDIFLCSSCVAEVKEK